MKVLTDFHLINEVSRAFYDFDESGSFRSYSHLVRSFQPNFRGESFRPDWGGSFRPSSKGGSFRPDLRGESFRPDLFISGKQIKWGSTIYQNNQNNLLITPHN